MTDILREQLSYVPEVHGNKISEKSIVCGGMGGSALPALVLKFLNVPQDVIVHRDYGLPAHVPADAAYIAISYSGDTEETLSFAHDVIEKGYPLSVVSSGGTLLQMAKEKGLSYVEIPTGFQPRDGIITTTKALLALLGEDQLLEELSHGTSFMDGFEGHIGKQAEVLSESLKNATPIFYSSTRNEALSYIAKIQCNETAKVPAFSNVFPELNHNEMQGYDTSEKSHPLMQQFVAVFMRDESDSERLQRRMELTAQVLRDKGVRTTNATLRGDTRSQTFLATWWLMRALAHLLASEYGVPADATPTADAFKRSL